MRQFLKIILTLLPIAISSQSLSASKLYEYANFQNIQAISKELKIKGFVTSSKIRDGYKINDFKKASEQLWISSNDELFMVIYKPSYTIYILLKEKLLTDEFAYAYTYNNNKYYETKEIRLGFNDLNGIISIFKPLKN